MVEMKSEVLGIITFRIKLFLLYIFSTYATEPYVLVAFCQYKRQTIYDHNTEETNISAFNHETWPKSHNELRHKYLYILQAKLSAIRVSHT